MALDVYMIVVAGNLCGQPVENVLHYRSTGTAVPNPQVIAADVASAWDATVQPNFVACLPDNYTLVGWKCKRINNGGGPTVVRFPAGPVVGTRPSSANDSAVGPLIVISYSNGVRFFAGRIFLPGIGDADIDNNQMVAALLTALDTLNATLTANLVGASDNYDFVVWSPTHANSFDILALTPSTKIGVQRRRLVPSF